MKTRHSTKDGLGQAKGWVLAAMRASALLALAAISAQLPARAAESGAPKPVAETHSAVVSLADLDLSTAAGMKAAQKRVRATARRLCGKVVDPWSTSHQPDYVACMDATMASALAQLPGPAVASNLTAH